MADLSAVSTALISLAMLAKENMMLKSPLLQPLAVTGDYAMNGSNLEKAGMEIIKKVIRPFCCCLSFLGPESEQS